MLSTILIILLLVGFIVGLNRGFIMQLLQLIGFVASFIIAAMYYDKLAAIITLWIPYPDFGDHAAVELILNAVNAEAAYYNGIAFFMIFIIARIVLQILANMLDFLARIPIIKHINIWAGGILGFLEVYLIIFLFLYIGALLPFESIQSAIEGSSIAKGILENTPVFTEKIQEMWLK